MHYPTVLVLGTSSGVAQADQTYARRLADQGYITIVPKYLEAYGISEAQRRTSFTAQAPAITADFVQILGELDKLPTAKPGANGAIGFSNGGFFALTLASTGKVKAGVSYYGALDGARAYPQLGPFKRMFSSASSPVLVLAGDEDQTIAIELVNRLAEILKTADAPHEMKIYSGAGHAFERSNAAPSNGSAANDAWKRTLAFLNANVR